MNDRVRLLRRVLAGTVTGPATIRLRHPAAWVDLSAEELGEMTRRFPPLRPGEALLVADDPVGWAGLTGRTGEPLGKGPVEDLRRAQRLALEYTPKIVNEEEIILNKPVLLERLVGDNPAAPEGGSFGLGLALARVSALLGICLPENLVASGMLSEDGVVGKVTGLSSKIAVLRTWYPGIHRMMVHPDLREEVEKLGIEAVGVKHLREAVATVFPEVPGSVRWEPLVDRLFCLAFLDSEGFTTWATLERSLENRPVLPEIVQWKAETAWAIARRKRGMSGTMPVPPIELRRPLRLKWLAQRVQDCNDQVEEEWEWLAVEAEAALAVVREETEWDLRLCGALGRLYLAWGRVDRARIMLGRAVEGWEALYLPKEISIPLCAWLRVEPGVEERAWRLFHRPDLSSLSRACLALELSRLAWKRGEPGCLEQVSWDRQPAWLQASRLRRLAVRGEATGLELERLADRYPDEAGDQWRLWRLHCGEDPERLVQEDAQFGREFQRRKSVSGNTVEQVLDGWPY